MEGRKGYDSRVAGDLCEPLCLLWFTFMPEASMPTKLKRPEDRAYFFDGGIRFGCTQCGECCTGAHGTMFVNDGEADRLARHLGLDRAVFLKRFAYPIEGGHSLREEKNGDCVFFKEGRCSVYEVRPTQCRTYPFWAENLRSERAWAATCRECPGIGEGRLYEKDELLAIVQQSLDATRPGEGTGPSDRGNP